MNYRLIKCTIANQIDRIRGEESITVPVTCTFMNESKDLMEVPGISSCLTVEEIPVTIEKAVENAKETLAKLINQTVGNGMSTERFTALMKSAVKPGVATELRKATDRTEYARMNEVAGEDKEKKVNGLCEALGIDTIDVTDWTNVEVLVLINYLERLTDPFIKEN